MDRLTIESTSPDETRAAGRLLAKALFPGACIALYGDLGAGKTVLAGGVIHGIGVPDETPVTSPTFVIISEYEGRLAVHHVDAYRLSGEADILELGSRELFFEEAVSVIEWAERIEGAIPDERLSVKMTVSGSESRHIEVTAKGSAHVKALGEFASSLAGDSKDKTETA